MKCQSLFSVKNEGIYGLWYAEFAHRVVRIELYLYAVLLYQVYDTTSEMIGWHLNKTVSVM